MQLSVLVEPKKFKTHFFNSSGKKKKIDHSLFFLLLLVKFKLQKLETEKMTS